MRNGTRLADHQGVAWRATAQSQHARDDERHFVFAAHRVPLALSAARQLSSTLDRLRHLSQVSARRHLGSDLDGAASRGWAGRPALPKAERSTSYSIAKGCRCGPSSTPPRSRTRWGRTRPRQNTPSLPVARTDLGRWRLKPWQVERSGDRSGFVVLPRRWGLSAPSPGSSGTGVSPRIPRTLPKLWAPSLPSHIQLALRRLARA